MIGRGDARGWRRPRPATTIRAGMGLRRNPAEPRGWSTPQPRIAEPLTRVFDDVLRPEQDVDITQYAESRYLIESVRYRQRVPDRVEARLYPPLLPAAKWWGQWSRRLPTAACTATSRTGSSGCWCPDRGRAHRMTGSDLTVGSAVAVVAQLVLVVAGAPVLVGVMRQVRARLEGRAGAGIWQPWRDLRKLMGKETIRPHGTPGCSPRHPGFCSAPPLLIAAVIPFLSTRSPLDGVADLFAVVALLLLWDRGPRPGRAGHRHRHSAGWAPAGRSPSPRWPSRRSCWLGSRCPRESGPPTWPRSSRAP